MTIIELSEKINCEIPACFSYVEGKTIKVTVRGKKSDKVYILNGEVSYIGNCATTAGLIAETYGLVKNF